MRTLSKTIPPKACPICQVAMQVVAEATTKLVHRCEQCGTEMIVAKRPQKGEV